MGPSANIVFYPATGKMAMWFTVLSGFLPVISIVIHCTGLIELRTCLVGMVLPALCIVVISGIKDPHCGRAMIHGWISGVLAVGLYDISRLPFIINGWTDFVPNIGAWLLNGNEPDAFAGYTWRYAGNGGGMGAAFFVLLRQLGIRQYFLVISVTYGLAIFMSLMFVLTVFSEASEMMFKVTPFTFTGSLIGHVVYGIGLGIGAEKFNRTNFNIK